MELHPAYPFFSIMIFLSFVASLVPWAWIKRDNIGILFLSLWLAMACLNQFVNSIIWYGNTRNSVPVWCDISSRLIVGLAVAIPGSIMCMVRRLYHVCSMKTFLLTPTQKRRALIEDLSICLGIPILQMDLEYIVEVNRYNIIEDIGCYPAPYNTWLAYVLSYSWPVILGAVTAVYSVFTIRAVSRNGKDIDKFFEHKSQRKHYLRLVILALLEITFATPFAVVVMVFDLTIFPVLPYISWENIHSNYSVVNEVPAVLWHSDLRIAVLTEMTQWILVLCAVTFFGVFGFSGEAMNAYKTGFWTVVGLLGIKKPEMPQEDLPRFQPRTSFPDTFATNPLEITSLRETTNHGNSVGSMIIEQENVYSPRASGGDDVKPTVQGSDLGDISRVCETIKLSVIHNEEFDADLFRD